MDREEINFDEEALRSPFSRIYLCPVDQIICCAIGLRYPVEIEALKKTFLNSIMLKHPRFCSLMIRDPNGGDKWRRTHVNIDDHIIIHHHHQAAPTTTECSGVVEDSEEAAVNAYLANMAVSSPLSYSKPLWELHVLMGLNCVVLRVHHSIGDGPSLMSMLWACFGKKRDGDEHNNVIRNDHNSERKNWRKKGIWGFVKSLWFTLVFGLGLLGRLLFKDSRSVIYGGDGVESWPRKLITVKFKLEDFKFIKNAIPNATINDVLLGVVSYGLSKYLDMKSPNALQQGLQVTGIVAVNLRKGPGLQELSALMKTSSGSLSSWGNKTGMFLQPLHCSKGLNPLELVRVMKSSMDQKKQSYAAYIPYLNLQLATSYLGVKVAIGISHKMFCNTTLLISNIMGPPEEILIADNPVTYIRVNACGLPQAMTIHLVSYAGRADLQVLVAKDIIPDSELLGKCLEEALLEMKFSKLSSSKE